MWLVCADSVINILNQGLAVNKHWQGPYLCVLHWYIYVAVGADTIHINFAGAQYLIATAQSHSNDHYLLVDSGRSGQFNVLQLPVNHIIYCFLQPQFTAIARLFEHQHLFGKFDQQLETVGISDSISCNDPAIQWAAKPCACVVLARYGIHCEIQGVKHRTRHQFLWSVAAVGVYVSTAIHIDIPGIQRRYDSSAAVQGICAAVDYGL